MELRDLVVTPIVIVLILATAYFIRPLVTDRTTRRYFFSGLLVKVMGAIALGCIYQFYYSGGDTYNFHTHGSRHIWNAFFDSPSVGLQLLFGSNDSHTGVYEYSRRIVFFEDDSSYFVIRVAAFFDLFTFSSYSATAILFSTVAFVGAWCLFLTFYKQYPSAHFGLALACLFVPSVFFWGSGVLKDTLVLAALGVATYAIYQFFMEHRNQMAALVLILLSFYVIFSIKKFVLQAYLPAASVWLLFHWFARVRSSVLRTLLVPFVVVIIAAGGYFSVSKVGEGDQKYSLDKIAQTAAVTAYDIRFWTGREAGSGYTLGELDGTMASMIRLAPAAINVTLFRPYLWEVKNPLMLLSALESLMFLGLLIYVVLSSKQLIKKVVDKNVLFAIVFSLIFAFAVGVSTFNFGTLSRYKIPLVPFYAVALVLLSQSKSEKKFSELDLTE